MRCEVCRGHVGLLATECACGFNLAARDPTRAAERARRQLVGGRRMLAIGLVGVAIVTALVLVIAAKPLWLEMIYYRTRSGRLRVHGFVELLGGVPMLAVMVGAYGGWLMARSRRRLAAARRILQLPTARIVR